MKVWVTRDNDEKGKVAVWNNDQHTRDSTGYWIDDYEGFNGHFDMTAKECKHILGFTPRKGSCKQYELTLKEVE